MLSATSRAHGSPLSWGNTTITNHVGVASPAAAAAGDDAAQAMRIRKLGEREPVRGELEQAGIVYKPVVFTTFGRPDAAASAIIDSIVKRGA